jgi:Na+/proline symporter
MFDPRKLVGEFASGHMSPGAKESLKSVIKKLNTPQGLAALEEVSVLVGPEGPVVVSGAKAAVTTAKLLFYVTMFCCVISFIIFLSTFVPSLTTKDEKKKASLKGAWIAFLVLCTCMAMIAFFFYRNSSLSRVVIGQLDKYGFDL